MFESSLEILRLVCGLTFFALGLAVLARASAIPQADTRNRLFCLSAFGVFQAAAMAAAYFPTALAAIPALYQSALYVPGFLALYYFAFGWNAGRPGLAHGIVLGSLSALALVPLGLAGAEYFPYAVAYGVAVPASLSAGLAFIRARAPERGISLALNLQLAAAACFALLGAAFVFFVTDGQGGAVAAVPTIVLAAMALAIALFVLILLNRADREKRYDLEARIVESEDILAKGEARLNRALGFAGVGSWEWDIVSDEVRWSDQMFRIHGYAAQEFAVTFSTLLDGVHADDRNAVERAIVRALEQAVSYEIDYRVLRPDQSIRFVRAHCEVESGPGGTAVRLMGTMSDVTDLVAAKLSAENAKSAAEAASAAKSNFMANMSHELRTPLNAIIGFSEILEKELFGAHSNPLYKNYAGDIQKGGHRLLAVINDVLTVSQFETGEMHLEEDAAINVEEMIKKCVRWAEAQAAKGEVALRVSVAPGLAALRGDPRLLVQALLNLLSNAVKFTPKGGVVEISAKENKLGGIALSVRDTGIGMTEEQIARIGEPFLQFDDSRSRKFEGTGLGLRIAKQILALHAAELEVQSKPGEGSIFSINMPPGRSVRQKSQRLRAWG